MGAAPGVGSQQPALERGATPNPQEGLGNDQKLVLCPRSAKPVLLLQPSTGCRGVEVGGGEQLLSTPGLTRPSGRGITTVPMQERAQQGRVPLCQTSALQGSRVSAHLGEAKTVSVPDYLFRGV